MAKPRKHNLQKDFKDICLELDYDPSIELISRRNELSEEANDLIAKAKKESKKKVKNQDTLLIGQLVFQANQIKDHIERLDFKLMPYLYARKSSHTIGDQDGNSILDAFAQAVKKNVSTNDSAKATQH